MKSFEDQSPVELQCSIIYPTSFEQHKIDTNLDLEVFIIITTFLTF
jgi:hypothetical protein